jgi:centromeric protein E
MEKIPVAVRLQPPSPRPAGASSTSGCGDRVWRIDDTRVSLPHLRRVFPWLDDLILRVLPRLADLMRRVGHVFDGAATNARICSALVRSIIRAAIDGFNSTVFAYGQTSSGKTYTMSDCDADPGIIPLTVRDLFETASQLIVSFFCIIFFWL